MAGRSPRATFHFRARVVAAEHGCMKIRDIYRRLSITDLPISESQLGKLLRKTPRQLNLEFLAAFCTAFQVTPNELLILQQVTGSSSLPKAHREVEGGSHQRARAAESEKANIKEAPQITSLPSQRAGHG